MHEIELLFDLLIAYANFISCLFLLTAGFLALARKWNWSATFGCFGLIWAVMYLGNLLTRILQAIQR